MVYKRLGATLLTFRFWLQSPSTEHAFNLIFELPSTVFTQFWRVRRTCARPMSTHKREHRVVQKPAPFTDERLRLRRSVAAASIECSLAGSAATRSVTDGRCRRPSTELIEGRLLVESLRLDAVRVLVSNSPCAKNVCPGGFAMLVRSGGPEKKFALGCPCTSLSIIGLSEARALASTFPS